MICHRSWPLWRQRANSGIDCYQVGFLFEKARNEPGFRIGGQFTNTGKSHEFLIITCYGERWPDGFANDGGFYLEYSPSHYKSGAYNFFLMARERLLLRGPFIYVL